MFCDEFLRVPMASALLTPPSVITIIGGGGKTSLMYALLRLLKKNGMNAIGAATTKILIHDRHQKRIVFAPDYQSCLKAAVNARRSAEVSVLCYKTDLSDSAKATGIPPEWVNDIIRDCRDCILIVEGDGSAGKSLKGYLPHEPVIPAVTRLVIPVIGIDALGEPITHETVHRPDRFCQLAATRCGEAVTPEMIAKVLFHPEGYLHNVPADAEVLPLINKVESYAGKKNAILLAQELFKGSEKRITAVVIASVRHSCYGVRKLEHYK